MYRQRAFTLIELLVVVAIIAIATSAFILLGFSFSNPEDAVRAEAQRLQARLQFAHEQGVMRGEDYGLRLNEQGYRMMRYDPENKWQDIDTDKLLMPHTLPDNMRIQIELEGIAAVLTESDDNLNKESARTSENDRETPAEVEIKPQIFLLASGETSPDFEVRFRISGSDISKAVHGDINGQYELVKD